MAKDGALQRVIKKTMTALKKGRPKNRNFPKFVAKLFTGGSRSDLAAASGARLAVLATTVFREYETRRPGRFSVAFDDIAGERPSTLITIINDDMPFLVDSVLGLLNDSSLSVDLVLHPQIVSHRDGAGKFVDVLELDDAAGGDGVRESAMAVIVDGLQMADERKELKAQLSGVLNDVRTTVLDWQTIMTRIKAAVQTYKSSPPPVPVDELAESIQFLEWLIDNNFTFMGVREYFFDGDPKTAPLKPVEGSGLGLLRDPEVHVLRRAGKLVAITPEIRQFLLEPAPLIITKANVKATVHRRTYMDYIGIKQFSDAGKLVGELRVIGLFTSTAYNQSARRIPLLRRKVAAVMEISGRRAGGHAGKALQNVLETYPRDDLFQIDVQTLYDIADGIRQLGVRPRTRLFVRRDRFDRFVSAIVFFPRDRFNTDVRMRTGALLADAYKGRVSAYYPAYPEGAMARVHFVIGRDEDETPEPDLAALEATIADFARTWDDHLAATLDDGFDALAARTLKSRFVDAFSAAYQDEFTPDDAIADIRHIERLDAPGDIGVEFYRDASDDGNVVRLKIFHLGAPIALSDRLPILENMALRAINERSYKVALRQSGDADAVSINVVRIHDIVLEARQPLDGNFNILKGLLEDCFLAVWKGEAANDGYNALVLGAAVAWRDVVILRAYSKYLRQAGISFSQRYMWTTFSNHTSIALLLIKLFRLRFDLSKQKSLEKRQAGGTRIADEIEQALAEVSSLDEDRIIRRFLNIIQVTLRTNVFQDNPDDGTNGALAFKIDSGNVDGLPEPRPFREIFVYSPDVEGVHLRGGMIARGGLRWSDRPEDFRTEVLGLVKAQQVKNAVIVPVGSKGGFVPHKLPAGGTREEIQAEAIRCYKMFISSLLCLTDNLDGTKVLPPADTVRYDQDDSYLVVAADKGTATFSDIANGISQGHGFWLDDAFASGGSAGYDHKKMGITARGGWEAVKRHFREMDADIQTTPFSVVGVGDMSGDVFGNGMLLSRKIRLLAAFDHRDIFIDPDPDTVKSFAERKRLFGLARSSWQSYSKDLISAGGGIFSRAEKSISLSPQIRKMTGLSASAVTPIELIRAILRMDADLLWFGGIGTYARASSESDDDAGDRANDALRVTADELRVKVIGEGANLGLTQRARIEFAEAGGRINNDAIDNSAGVNSSDVEVNIKIAFGAVEAKGKLDRAGRNKFLALMTDEVGALVLRNNYRQTLTISISEAQGYEELGFQVRMMRNLERDGLLDREIEFLPDDAELLERDARRQAMVRPELAVLLAYAKITLYDALLASDVPDDPYLGRELERYFPAKLWNKYPDAITSHRLRREIIATMLANSMINRGGPTFVSRLSDETGAGPAAIASAFAVARDAFGLLAFNDRVDALDNKISGSTQLLLYQILQSVLRDQTAWFLMHGASGGALLSDIEHYHSGVATLKDALSAVLPASLADVLKQKTADLVDSGVPAKLAGDLAELEFLVAAPDIVLVSGQSGRTVRDAAGGYFEIGNELKIDQLLRAAENIDASDYFDRLALNRVLDAIADARRQITVDVLSAKGNAAKAVANWRSQSFDHIDQVVRKISDLLTAGPANLSKLTLANSYLRDLCK